MRGIKEEENLEILLNDDGKTKVNEKIKEMGVQK